jgi:hypothetical protein
MVVTWSAAPSWRLQTKWKIKVAKRPQGGFVEGEGPNDAQTRKGPVAAPPSAGERAPFPWPWGLVALGVMALAWVGIYLLWNGIAFVLGL